MENVAQENEKSIAGVIKINEKGVLDHIDSFVRQSFEDTLNALLNAEADAICNASRYQRSIENISEALWGTPVSPSTVSDLNQKIYDKIEEWRMQPITGEHPYVFMDGVFLNRSWSGEVQNVSGVLGSI